MANIISGIAPTVSPAPNAPPTGNDPALLTDGFAWSTPGYTMWGETACGWVWQVYVSISWNWSTLKAIGEIGIHMAGPGRAGYYTPYQIRVLILNASDEWIDIGDMIQEYDNEYVEAFEGAWMRMDVACAGKGLKLLVIPHTSFAVDEIECIEGSVFDSPDGTEVTDDEAWITTVKIQAGASRRFATDEAGIEAAIEASDLSGAEQAIAKARVQTALAACYGTGESGVTLLPLSDEHEALYAAQGAFWADLDRAGLTVEQVNPFDDVDLYRAPPPASSTRIRAHGLAGETAYVALNFYAPAETEVEFYFDGVTDAATPSYIAAYRAVLSDTWSGKAVAHLLMPITPTTKWTLTCPAGQVQQVILAVDLANRASETGTIAIEADSVGIDLEIAFAADVCNPANYSGGDTFKVKLWDYCMPGDSQTAWLGTARAEILALLRSYGILPRASYSAVSDPSKIAGWIDEYPDADRYYVLAQYAISLTEAEAKAKVVAVVDAFRNKGIDPSKVYFIPYDEPNTAEEQAQCIELSTWIKEAEPDVRIFCNPSYATPEDHADVFAVCDAVYPAITHWSAEQTAYYQSLGKELGVYTSGNDSANNHTLYRSKAWWAHDIEDGCNAVDGYGYWSVVQLNSTESSWRTYEARGNSRSQLFIAEDQMELAKPLLAVHQMMMDYALLSALRSAALAIGNPAAASGTSIIADLVTALKTQWTAGVDAGTISADVAGPYRDREPAQGEYTFPYCIVTITHGTSPDGQSGQSEYWQGVIEFAVYDETDGKVEGYADGVGEYFDGRLPGLAVGKGEVLKARRTSEGYGREKDGIHRAVLRYEYVLQRPRVPSADHAAAAEALALLVEAPAAVVADDDNTALVESYREQMYDLLVRIKGQG